MANKKLSLSDLGGLVYSTDPNYKPEQENEAIKKLDPIAQKLKIILEKKHRGGKVVSIIYGYVGASEDLEDIGKALKTFCGTGGSVKDGEIIIQGDQREKILQWLLKNGYKQSKKV